MTQPHPQQILQRAVDEHRAGRLAEAEGLYRQVLAAQPDNADALRLLGVMASQVGKHEVAIQLIGRALQIQPNSAEGWSDIAAAHTAMGKGAEALAAYQKALALRPGFAAARTNLGELLKQMDRIDEAMACWKEAARSDPKLAEPHYNMGGVLFAQGKAEEAAECFARAIAAQPLFAPAYNNLGAVRWSQGKRDEALAAFRKAVELEPKYAEAWNNLGSMIDEGGDSEAAIECWRKAIALRPDYADPHNNLGLALDRQGDSPGAIAEWKEALRLRPDWVEPQYYLSAAKEGAAPSSAPARYITKLFNQYAHNFDDHLLRQLEYKVPGLLMEAIRRAGVERVAEVIDLGCGTGLGGVKVRAMAGRMVGVDLSPKMIEKARERNIYDELVAGDLMDVLGARCGDVDLILAADVFLYVGDLTAVFQAAKTALRPGALMAFSVEKTYENEGDLVLRETRRFSHSRQYVERLVEQSGMEMVELSEAVLRMDGRCAIEGMIVVVRKK